MPNAIAYLNESTASGWERTLYAFLAEKERRSGSLRTVQSYSTVQGADRVYGVRGWWRRCRLASWGRNDW